MIRVTSSDSCNFLAPHAGCGVPAWIVVFDNQGNTIHEITRNLTKEHIRDHGLVRPWGVSRTMLFMAGYLDVSRWARRELFEFFIGFDKPYFNICTRLDITNLLARLRDRPGGSVSLAYHYFALRAANEIEPFRYRLRQGQVFVHDVIHGGTTVMMPGENFTLAYFEYHANFETFMGGAEAAVKELLTGDGAFKPDPSDDRIHFTTLPWVSFTSFSHARNWGREDSIPKMAFGKFVKENRRTLLPFSVEVHHALMDGLHVGRYVSRLEELLAEPEAYIAKR